MRLVKGTEATGDHKLFDTCDPVILRRGVYARRCGSVVRVKRLFIGYGVFALPREINEVWRPATWRHGSTVAGPSFRRLGGLDRTLSRFPPAGGKDVTLREWRVMLVGATPGRHTIRYRFRDPSGWIDATWRFTVSG